MIYQVIVDISNSEVDRVFDYSCPFDVEEGSRVEVPFGHRFLEGVVIGTKQSTDVKTKDIIRKLDDFRAVNAEMIALCKYMKAFANIRFCDSLRLCMPSKLRGGKVKILVRNYVTLEADKEIARSFVKNAPKQLKLLEEFPKGGEYESVLIGTYGQSAVKGLIDKGILHRENVQVRRKPLKELDGDTKKVVLNDEQQNAVKTILENEGTTVLYGVTGSGKTEVYMAVIQKVLEEGKTAIMLVPEISLTPQMLGVFRGRFGDNVGLLHSGMSDGERFDEWLKILRGDAKVVLGARSAVFAPLENVGVIIIDEEHDTSYVSDSNPRYHTHDIAEFRRRYNSCRLVLGSATPSLDTYYKAQKGEFKLVKMMTRANRRAMPIMEIVDMRKEVRQGNTGMFGKRLLAELDRTLKNGNQAMIYINRRGFASFLRCKNCGYVPKCTDCEVSLTYHKDENVLKCHYCGKKFYMLDACPECGSDKLSFGHIGTETVMEEIYKIFPQVKVLRLDNDTTTAKDSTAQILSAFAKGEAQILVGTQMIVKGHDFGNVTLVGVLDADLSLYYSDYRSNETTFQQITQVAGRAGRNDKEGSVIIQTYNPAHYVFRFARQYDYEGFFEKENNIRETTVFPPFSKIMRVLVKSEKEEKALVAARECYAALRKIKEENVGLFRVQAMQAPVKRISNEFRFQVVIWIRTDAEKAVTPRVYETAEKLNKKPVVTFVEVNPVNMR